MSRQRTTFMKRKKTVEIPEREETVPDGFYMIKIGDSRAMKRPKKVRAQKGLA